MTDASAVAAAARRDYLAVAPPPSLLLWETPFWLALLYIALLPGSLSPWWEWFDLPVRSAEGAVVLSAAFYAIPAILDRRHGFGFRASAALLVPMLVALAYAFGSTFWVELDADDLRAMRLTLIYASAAPLLAWGVVGGYSREDLYHFVWRLSAFLALVSVVYAAESILSLGLRSELGQNTLLDFGIERVRGPLFGSSTGYLVLLPALAFAIQHVIDVKSRRAAGLGMVLALLVTMLGLGSRAALVLLSIYLVLLSFLIKSARKRLLAVLLTVVFTAAAAGLVFSQANTDRLQNFEDDSRRATHVTAARAVEEQPLSTTLRGAGYGAIWNWYLTDSRNGERLATGDNIIRTPFGPSLYHSHSTFLEMAMELGAVGAVAFATMSFGFLSLVARCWRRGVLQAFSCGLAATGLGLLFDLFLFKNTTVNLIWWLYAIAMSMLARYEPEDTCGS
ncbi:MAG: O-antigen ligase family protein [Bryobacteraceae bacterium]|nr:O-antigen ligase family protein [Bryobacteraceae bacterium]